MSIESTEYFLPPEEIAKRLSLTRRQVVEMARAGHLPAHPAGLGDQRVMWRFLWSEVRESMLNGNAGAKRSVKSKTKRMQ